MEPFELPDESYRLVIDEGTYAGAQARVRGLTAGELADLAAFAGDDIKPEAAGDLFDVLGKNLLEWNVQRSGIPVPADPEGVRSAPFPLVLELVGLWMEAGADVSAPLGSPSTGGGPPVAASIPMEPLSPSLPSS